MWQRLWKSIVNDLTMLFNSWLELLFPRYCIICDRRLLPSEQYLCISCLFNMPITKMKGEKGNILERKVWDDLVITERGNSYLYYYPQSDYRLIFLHFKYMDHPEVARHFGKIMADDLTDTDFFDGIDVLLPVPLSRKKRRKRGYNQCEYLAFGVNEITHIPIDTTSVERKVNNKSQTTMSGHERWHNVENIFQVVHPEYLEGKHVLIIDDVFTTGSTIRSLARSLKQACNVKISFLCLGTSYHNQPLPFPDKHRYNL